MGDQQYLPLSEGAKRIDKGLRRRTGNLSTFSAWEGGEGRGDGEKEVRKAGGESSRRKESFQKEEVTNSFKHYREVK